MSTSTVDSPAAEPKAETTSETVKKVVVALNELIIGQPLQCPIHDENGILLLDEGSVNSADFKKSLKSRGLEDVKLDAADVDKVTLRNAVMDDVTDIASFRTELAENLDEMIEREGTSVVNTGAAIRDKMVIYGKKAYDLKQREELISRHEENSDNLHGMMRNALDGGGMDGSEVTAMAANYLTDMSADADSLLTIASEAIQQRELSEHCL